MTFRPLRAKKIVHKLIASADVLSHNFRLGVPERLQIDWETCLKINPRLVHVWMGTYGENGVHARRPGAHPIPGAIMGGAMRQMGRGMPPPPEQVMDIEETVEATPLAHEIQLGTGPKHLPGCGHGRHSGPSGTGPHW